MKVGNIVRSLILGSHFFFTLTDSPAKILDLLSFEVLQLLCKNLELLFDDGLAHGFGLSRRFFSLGMQRKSEHLHRCTEGPRRAVHVTEVLHRLPGQIVHDKNSLVQVQEAWHGL